MTEEIWKDIPNFEGRYAISNYGRIKNLKNGKIRRTTVQNSGYLMTTLWNKKDKERHIAIVHRLVAELFVEGAGECVNHIDGNKLNNYYKNLEWCSLAYNTKHAYEHKLINNHSSIKIIELDKDFRTIAECVEWLRNNGHPKAIHSNIILTIQGKRHHAYGYTYKYIDKII